MGYTPPTIATADYQIARKAIFGGEREIWISRRSVYDMATITSPVANSGVQVNDTYNTFDVVAPTGADLVAVVNQTFECTLSGVGVAKFAGTNASGGATTGYAQLSAPGYAGNRLVSFPEGIAFDVIPAVSGAKWDSIGFNGWLGDVEAKSSIKLLNLPDLTSFQRIGCTTAFEWAPKIRPAISIPCGMDGTGGGIKPGRTEEPTFSLKSKDAGFFDGLARYAGKECTIMAKAVKEGNVTTEVIVLGNCYFTVKMASGDGNDEASQSADGKYQYAAVFMAP